MNERTKEIQDNRAKSYGDIQYTLAGFAGILTGILESHYQMKLPHPVPSRVAALILAGMKLGRAAVDLDYVQDNFDDAVSYLDIANRLDGRKRECEE